MPDIADAVNWKNLKALNVPVLGYHDGPISMWPPEAFVALGGRVVGLITVLADEACPIFDAETGDAGNPAVATAVANRFQARKPSTVYTNADNCPDMGRQLRIKGVFWTDASFWPHPGCYLWAAAPGTTPGRLPSWCPVSPVAVQDRALGLYDLSTTFYGWPAVAAPVPPRPPSPPPVPPLPKGITVQLLQIQQGHQGRPVRVLQILLNGENGAGLGVDGVFGPKTGAAVRSAQARAQLPQDGIVGVHTWGMLLGVPQ